MNEWACAFVVIAVVAFTLLAALHAASDEDDRAADAEADPEEVVHYFRGGYYDE